MNNPAAPSPKEIPPPVVAVIPFISRQASRNWRVSCQLLQETIASILALPEDFMDVTVVGHTTRVSCHIEKSAMGWRGLSAAGH